MKTVIFFLIFIFTISFPGLSLAEQDNTLSDITFVCGDDKAFTSIYSTITSLDVKKLWGDLSYLEANTNVRHVTIFIDSFGGDIFAGIGLSDIIVTFRNRGFHVVGYGVGTVVSAALSVLVVCSERIGLSGTFFMVHETLVSPSKISQNPTERKAYNKMSDIVQERYFDILVKYTKLSSDEWHEKAKEISWFSTKEALKYGIIDRIE